MNTLLAVGEFVGPGFDFKVALVVALLVTVVVLSAVVIAMTAGASTPAVIGLLAASGKVLTAVATIALTAAVVAGTVSGWNRQAHATETPPDPVLQEMNELDVAFEPSLTEPKMAKDFTAIVVHYRESGQKTAVERHIIHEERNDAFYSQLEKDLDRWLSQHTSADSAGKTRKVCVYMSPFPGDGVYERIKQLCERRGGVVVSRIEAPWTSAAQ